MSVRKEEEEDEERTSKTYAASVAEAKRQSERVNGYERRFAPSFAVTKFVRRFLREERDERGRTEEGREEGELFSVIDNP